MASARPNIVNRKASHEYFFLQTFEAGMMLTGTEVKSIRAGKVQMLDAFCAFEGGELYVRNMDISPYEHGTVFNHEARRKRKLLLNGRELAKLRTALQEKGVTLIPVKIYFNERNFAKMEIALAKGKKLYDKRETLKAKDAQRDMDRASTKD